MVDFKSRLNNALEEENDNLLSQLVHGGIEQDFTSQDSYPSDYSHVLEEKTEWNGETEADAIIEEEQGREIALRADKPLPRYLKELEKLSCSPQEKVEMLSLFEGGEVIKFTKFVGKTVSIIGCIIWTRPPMTDRSTGEQKEGYDEIRFLLDEFTEDGIPKIMTGSLGLLNHTFAMLSANGWYVWDKPVRYRCLWDGSGTPFRMIDQDRVERMQEERNARQGKNK